MKRMLVILAALTAFASFESVQAAPWQGFYAGAVGGANFIQSNQKKHHKHHHDDDVVFDSSHHRRDHHKIDYDTGYMVGGFLGYRWCEGFRAEGEISYRFNTLKHTHHHKHCDDHLVADLMPGETRHRGHHSSISYMANLLYDIDLCSDFVPYVGGGIGYSHEQRRIKRKHGSFTPDFDFDHSSDHNRHHHRKNSGFAWQVIAGLGYEVSCNIDVSVDYRFLKGRQNKIYNHAIGAAGMYHF